MPNEDMYFGEPNPPPIPKGPGKAKAPAKPRKNWAARFGLLSFVGLAAAGGAGYLAWTFHGEVADQAADLTQLQVDHARVKGERDKLAAEGAGLRSQLATCDQAKTATGTAQAEAATALAAMQSNLSATKEELETLRAQHALADQRAKALEVATAKFQKLIDTGTLAVSIKHGNMVVQLPSEVLFPSASADLSRPGELALMAVAVVLKQLEGRRFLVVGHTDNVPVKGTAFKDNWQLSTARAVTVTEFFISAGLDGKSLLAAGHGELEPVESNKTKEGRDKNRRIEIIVLPDLSEVAEAAK